MNRKSLILVLVVLTMALAACAADDTATTDTTDTATDTTDTVPTDEATAEDADAVADDAGATGEETSYDVTLTGDAEVPGPGAEGTADVTLTIVDGQACLTGSTTDVGAVEAGHIHQGGADVAGDVVVNLNVTTDADGEITESCGDIDEATATAIADTPADFYINLHTADHPDGAVRAQIG